MRLSALAAALPSTQSLTGDGDPEIAAITADSRRVTPGSLFVAVRGETSDGHDFIPDALARGAAAIVAERILPNFPISPTTLAPAALWPTPGPAQGRVPNRSGVLPTVQPGWIETKNRPKVPYIVTSDSREALAWLAAAWHGFPARQLIMLGVTGTDGKTTTASLIHSILLAAGLRAGLISTVSALIGDEMLDTGFHVTTPDALEVQAYLARMVAAGLTHCVLEVTSHGLAQRRVTGCEFDVAVVTNITHEHLDYHKNFENYRAAKGQLFAGLAAAVLKPGGPAKAAILNADDSSAPYLETLLDGQSGVRLLRYSLAPGSEVWAGDVANSPAGLRFVAHGPGFAVQVRSPLVGAFNVSNCLAAVAATAGALGLPPAAVQSGLAALGGVPGRMQRIDLGQAFTAVVDFAHTPNALRRALETGRQLLAPGSAGRVIAVFGSAGLRDVEKRQLMAETSAQLADITILTAEDPRTESLEAILAAMAEGARRRGAVEGQNFYRVPDRRDAIRLAVRLAQPGDIVLACGKGHEQSMCFGTVEYPWDERTAMRSALAESLGRAGPEMPFLPQT